MRGTFLELSLVAMVQFFILSPAYAGLGENESSIARDSQRFDAVQKTISSFNNYHVQGFVSSGNTVIREYVNSDGMIFGISCSGITQPDLDDLLGSYFLEYKNAKNPNRIPGRRLASTNTDHIVVEEGGHMRSSYTRAWVPSLVPTGMSLNEIH